MIRLDRGPRLKQLDLHNLKFAVFSGTQLSGEHH